MPYANCLCCGGISHLNVANVLEWYQEHYPNIPVGSLVPGKCFDCWQELRIDDKVVVRLPIGTERPVSPGTHGRIADILSSAEHGTLFLVHLDDGRERYFIRGEQKKGLEIHTPKETVDG